MCDSMSVVNNLTLRPWVVLIQTQREALLTYIMSILRCRALAEDVLQDTYLRLSNISENQLDSIDNYSAYCYQTARNIAIDLLRKRARENWVDLECLSKDECLEEQPDLESAMQQACTEKCVGQVISTLPTRHRTIFSLYKCGNYKQKEIAQICAISPTLVNFTLQEIIATCKQALSHLQLT